MVDTTLSDASDYDQTVHAVRLPASQLHGRKDQYKIKLRGAGYRLVYRVEDDIVTVTVIGVGKRENDDIYNATLNRN
ncbi:type II toxin-antitoxin system RelE family toxin [Klebsiella pneumoniae]|uniref:type II toxin-antitoxin system RelE family toxin n=1 Tax=Klebsiella pneumoniae TaxID=573 RepID=UPI0039E16C4C